MNGSGVRSAGAGRGGERLERGSGEQPELGDELGAAIAATVARGDADAARLAATFGERAAADGSAEVAYAFSDSPFGEILVAATERGVVRVVLPRESFDGALEGLADRVSPRIVEAPKRLDKERRELDQYFSAKRREFDLPLDWRCVASAFRLKVLEGVAAVPYGAMITYGDAAEEAGNRRAHRAAATAIAQNPLPIVVPCHRVIRSGGVIGNYGGGPEMKRALLEFEGAIKNPERGEP